MSNLQVLKKLESTLEDFLAAAVEADDEQIRAFRSVDSLNDIARDSLRGRIINSRLRNWFEQNKPLLQSDRPGEPEITSIANLLSDIKSGLDDSNPESRKLSEEISLWRSKGIIPKRKLVLKSRAKASESDPVDGFMAVLARESDHLNSGEFEGRYLLSILNDVLKSAEAKEDKMFIHLAGSIIYYLKMKGYKVAPFVGRLKKIEQNRLGDGNAE